MNSEFNQEISVSINKKHFCFLILLLMLALCIRIYAANNVPLICDETRVIHFANNHVSFNYHNFKFPAGGNEIVDAPPLVYYVAKLSSLFFGNSPLGNRALFLFLGTLSLFFFFRTTYEHVGPKEGFISLIILTFSQFHIGISRLALGEILSVFFMSLSLYSFFKILHTDEKRWIYYLGLSIGVGYLSRELTIILLPVFIIYALMERRQYVFRNKKHFVYSLVGLLLTISPNIIWSFRNHFSNYTSDKVFNLGFSLRAFYLYLAELFSYLFTKTKYFFWDLINDSRLYFITPKGEHIFLDEISNEYPVIHWPLSLLIFASVFYCLINYKTINKSIKCLTFLFISLFMIASVFAGSVTLFDQHTWAALSFYPGVIILAFLLVNKIFIFRYTKMIFLFLGFYWIFNSYTYINTIENLHATPNDLKVKYYLHSANIYLKQKEYEYSFLRCRWVLNNSRNQKSISIAEGILNQLPNAYKNSKK